MSSIFFCDIFYELLGMRFPMWGYNMYMKTEDTKEEKPTPSKDEKAPDGMFR